MGSPTGFIAYDRVDVIQRPVEERLLDFRQVSLAPSAEQAGTQATRCMGCGIPFCHAGCPLGNRIPDWNELVYREDWTQAYHALRQTNNFPEFTGQVCPAPCESACVAGIDGDAVAIEQIEWAIAEQAYALGIAVPRPPTIRTGRRVAVIGSGPAGLACADQLNHAGHEVVVFERAPRAGGLLRYGIPDFKLEKWVLDRRLDLMRAEGVRFRTGVNVGVDVGADELEAYDAVVLCIGATAPRDLQVPGRDLPGVHFAMDYLRSQNRVVSGHAAAVPAHLSAADRHVVVIGGGDTGSDCVGTAHRQGALSVTQFELLSIPPEDRPPGQPWPYMPLVLKTTSSHREGGDRQWSIMTQAFAGSDRVESVRTCQVRRHADGFVEIPGTQRTWPAELVLIAVGYTGPERSLASTLALELNENGTLGHSDFSTSRAGFFVAGDARRGQSLVVWAISEGREVASRVNAFLEGPAALAAKGPGDLPRR